MKEEPKSTTLNALYIRTDDKHKGHKEDFRDRGKRSTSALVLEKETDIPAHYNLHAPHPVFENRDLLRNFVTTE